MEIKNTSRREIQVAINKWGGKGNTDFHKISPGKTNKWNREDRRGFVMMVSRDGKEDPYYIFYDSEIVVDDNIITDRGEKIESIVR